jgi:hypothetical protein
MSAESLGVIAGSLLKKVGVGTEVSKNVFERGSFFGGMARTRAMSAACSGQRRAACENSEWIAASRLLRVVTELPRSCSRWSRNAPTNDASR